MNICEYRIKEIFFKKVEAFREERDMNIVDAIKFLGMKRTQYYKARTTKETTKGVIKRLFKNCYARTIFSMDDFEKIC